MEHEINLNLIDSLSQKLNEMRSEFYEIKKRKEFLKNNLEKSQHDIIKDCFNSYILEMSKNDNNLKKKEIENLNIEINQIELNFQKKETLFNKYLILLRNLCHKSKEQSYLEMNPCIINETGFEEKIKEEFIKLIDLNDKFSEDDKRENKYIIEVYFKDLFDREIVLQSLIVKNKNFQIDKDSINIEISLLKESLNNIDKELTSKKLIINELSLKERLDIDEIEKRNKMMTSNLEKLGELEFKNYLKSNENLLKRMKKIYGNKILDKVFKAQRQKLLENVVIDHSNKKNKVNEYKNAISKFELSSDYFSQRIIELENQYIIVY